MWEARWGLAGRLLSDAPAVPAELRMPLRRDCGSGNRDGGGAEQI